MIDLRFVWVIDMPTFLFFLRLTIPFVKPVLLSKRLHCYRLLLRRLSASTITVDFTAIITLFLFIDLFPSFVILFPSRSEFIHIILSFYFVSPIWAVCLLSYCVLKKWFCPHSVMPQEPLFCLSAVVTLEEAYEGTAGHL